MIKFIIVILAVFSSSLISGAPLNRAPQRTALFNSLNPFSLSQNLSFYELYPQTLEGKAALGRAWRLLGTNEAIPHAILTSQTIPQGFISSIVQLVNRNLLAPSLNLCEEQLTMIERLGSHLANRSLKGLRAQSEEEILQLPDEEVDLARGLLLSQLEDAPDKMKTIRQYEAVLDLMALQILSYLQPYGGLNAPLEHKIDQINAFVFKELHFRYPPHSSYAPEIDMYTFLPSVLDTRRGVCLGVSLLYIAIAQRLNAPVEIVTPPGHIYVRCKIGNAIRNIETTARGIHLPCETYLGMNTRSLQTRTVKQTIGMAHFNQAAVYSQQDNYQKAVDSYRKAECYHHDDIQLKELLAYHLIFLGDEKNGKEILQSISNEIASYNVVSSTIIADYLNNKVDGEGIKAIFMHIDETQESLLEKQRILLQVLNQYPAFREGIIQLATTWLQLKRDKEALEVLQTYHQISDKDPTVEYYLSALNAERSNYPAAWKHLRQAEKLTALRNHTPQALKELEHELRRLSPE